MLELRKMNLEDAPEQWKYVAAAPADENGMTNPYEGVTWNEYISKVLPMLLEYEHPSDMPEWFVPESFYYLWDEQVLVGEFRIRHHLTEQLKNGAGHIGYRIKDEFRGRGYGTRGLALALNVAREIIPENEIYLRVLKNNEASVSAIQKNGGYIAGKDELHLFFRISK